MKALIIVIIVLALSHIWIALAGPYGFEYIGRVEPRRTAADYQSQTFWIGSLRVGTHSDILYQRLAELEGKRVRILIQPVK